MAEEFAQSLRTLRTFLVILQSALSIAQLETGMESFLGGHERLLQPLGYSGRLVYPRVLTGNVLEIANARSIPSSVKIVFQLF